MKQYLKTKLIVAFLLTLTAISAKAQDPNFHIYLCFGQSNMEGQGTIEAQDQTVDSRFQIMQAVACTGKPAGKWRTATPPLARCNTNLGPADYFGREMVKNLPSNIKVGIVFVAVAGCKIELFDKTNYASYANGEAQWMKNIIAEYGGNPYGKLVELAKLAQKDGVIKGILMHQGESNTGDQNWPNKVKGVYTNLLTDLGLTANNVPLLSGQVVDAAQGGASASMNTIINTLPNTIPTAHVISSSGCTDVSDNLHFTSAGYRLLGTRYATKMLSLLPPSCTTPAPTVPAAQIAYEVGDVATTLSATGSSLKWYVGASTTAQTSAPTPITASAGTTTYSVTQTSNGCESARTSITVTVANTFKLFKTNTPIEIDGVQDAAWNTASIATLSKVLSGTVTNNNDLSANFKALWDNTYLYILGEINDQTLTNDSPNWYDDDAVEVYMDINNDKPTAFAANDGQFTFGWNDGTTVGANPTGRTSTGVNYSMVAKTDGYVFEARIPWSALSANPALNQLVGLDFMVNDDDNGSTRDKKISWTSATDNAYQDPSLFGVAKLVDAIVTTGIADNSILQGVSVYPNPFHESVNLVQLGAFTYQLMDASGKVLESGEGNDEVKIGQNANKGLYLLKVTQNGISKHLKLLKE
jgi:hypothetical protein